MGGIQSSNVILVGPRASTCLCTPLLSRDGVLETLCLMYLEETGSGTRNMINIPSWPVVIEKEQTKRYGHLTEG